ncbi:MAG: methionine--tRNA ligase [Janthinobacterium lividum]
MAYITTPIYYVNDDPHIGHIYTNVSADVLARFSRLSGHDTFLLTGTDEHAVKVVDAAKAKGLATSAWVLGKAAVFADAFRQFDVQVSDFIRTSEPRHVAEVTLRMQQLIESGDVYVGTYEGWYDAGQEEYVSETKAKQADFCSVVSRRPLVRRKESCLYFKLSAYESQIRELIESDRLKVRPMARRQELLARLREGLIDIPCSRPRENEWGIAVPAYPEQVVYVWIDALLNYLTAVDTPSLRSFWPPSMQLVGKDIVWFHAVIWPAMLLALRQAPASAWIELPKAVRAHSFWIRDGEKMSKSMGNFIALTELTALRESYGSDALRFFLISAGPNEAADADFSAARLHDIYTSALANTVGNCCSRVVAMIVKFCDSKIPARRVDSGFALTDVMNAVHTARTVAASGEFPALITEALRIIRATDAFVHSSQPFRLAGDASNQPLVDAILHDALEALRLASMLLWPVMPSKIGRFWSAIGLEAEMSVIAEGGVATDDRHFQWGGLSVGQAVETLAPMFPRVNVAPLAV